MLCEPLRSCCSALVSLANRRQTYRRAETMLRRVAQTGVFGLRLFQPVALKSRRPESGVRATSFNNPGLACELAAFGNCLKERPRIRPTYCGSVIPQQF
jgi:hypothetical protein